MNASYKIVLLGAFILFAAVIGYYVLSDGSGEAGDKQDNAALADNSGTPVDPNADDTPEEEPDDTPPIRPGIDRSGLDRPGLDRPGLDDPINEVTIGTPSGDDIDVHLGPPTGVDPSGIERTPGTLHGPVAVVRDGPAVPGSDRPGPGTDNNTGGPGSSATSEETARPGPGVGGTETGGTEGTDPDTGAPTDTPGDTGTADPTETETPERPAPPATGDTPRTYTVKPGDTFASIALTIYGEERAWFDIAQANPSIDPKRLQVDQVIVLPRLDEDTSEPEEATPPAPGNDQTYTVRPGDNLTGIAEKFYGDSEAWDLIYNRNRDKIGPRPDMIQVGMELIIPQAYSGAE